MDHRWDEMLQAEHRRRTEESRYAKRGVEDDPDVERRDQLARARLRPNTSAWDIGASHWDQRDLYTRNSRTDDAGYGMGPRIHPDIGSYAYDRKVVPESTRVVLRSNEEEPTIYEREAYPWLNYYDRVQPITADDERGLWGRVKHEAREVIGKLTGHPHVHQEPLGWQRADAAIHADVCESLDASQLLDSADIEVEVKDGEVTLRGTVRDRPSKRLAETLAEQVQGVWDIHNRLTVRKDDDELAFTAPVQAY
jgi:hypothetical protein